MSVLGLNKALNRIPAWPIYILGFGGVAWLFWLGFTGQLGPEPINALEREYGEISLKLLIVSLAITPLRTRLGVNLIKFRRALGLTAFIFALAHVCVFAILDVQSVERLWTEIVKRPYVTIGTLSFLLLIPLAITSNNRSLRKLGPITWRKLHKLTYPATALAALHFIWLSKGFQLEPIVFFVVICGLIAARYLPHRSK